MAYEALQKLLQILEAMPEASLPEKTSFFLSLHMRFWKPCQPLSCKVGTNLRQFLAKFEAMSALALPILQVFYLPHPKHLLHPAEEIFPAQPQPF